LSSPIHGCEKSDTHPNTEDNYEAPKRDLAEKCRHRSPWPDHRDISPPSFFVLPIGYLSTKNAVRKTSAATEGEIKEITYWWPRHGSDKPLKKTSFYTKLGDQICSVGYYKE